MFLPLYWLYLWQIKEYRWDRMASHLRTLSWAQRLNELLVGKYRRPRFTPKLFLILMIGGITWLIKLLMLGYVVSGVWYLVFGIFTWFLWPLWISFAVVLVSLIERPLKQSIRNKAKKKSEHLLKDTLIIGVTGSYGKTTTKEFIAHVLEKSFRVAKTPTHVNYDIALAQFILNDLQEVPEILVVEYASYGPGNIKADIENVLRPHWAVMTGIALQHLELFGSIENIVKAKMELVEGIKNNGKVFYNAYDTVLSQALDKNVTQEKIGFGKEHVAWVFEKLSWRLSLRGQVLEHLFPSNLAAAVAIAKQKGMSEEAILSAIETIEWLPRTMEVIESKGTIIDDSYSSNPHSFEKLMRFVSKLAFTQKILVTSGVIELGQKSFEINNMLSKHAQETFDRVYITSKPLALAWEAGTSEHVVFLDNSTIGEFYRFIESFDSHTLIIIEGRVPEKIRKFIINNQ